LISWNGVRLEMGRFHKHLTNSTFCSLSMKLFKAKPWKNIKQLIHDAYEIFEIFTVRLYLGPVLVAGRGGDFLSHAGRTSAGWQSPESRSHPTHPSPIQPPCSIRQSTPASTPPPAADAVKRRQAAMRVRLIKRLTDRIENRNETDRLRPSLNSDSQSIPGEINASKLCRIKTRSTHAFGRDQSRFSCSNVMLNKQL